MKFKRPPKSVLGLGVFAGTERSVTARVKLDGDRVEVLSCETDTPSVTESLPRGVALGRLGSVLYRFDLPPADAATTEKLIAAQLETRIPGQAEHVRWGWQRSETTDTVAVVTVARRRLEALAAEHDAEPSPGVITTATSALHEVVRETVALPDRDNLLLIARLDQKMHLLRYCAGQIEDLQTIDFDQNTADEDLALLVRQTLSEASDSKGALPTIFTLVGDVVPSAEAVSAYEKAIGATYRRAEGLFELNELDGLRSDQIIAVGAAIAAARPEKAINLAASDHSVTAGINSRPSWRHWSVAAVVLLAALALWYASDVKQAQRLNAAVEEASLEAKDLTALNTDLQVARYLETAGPTFLAILDEFSHNTEGFIIDEMRYERDGQFTVSAVSRSSQQINRLAAELSKMRTLSSVQIRSQATKDRDKVEYKLVAVPSKQYFAPFAPPIPEPEVSDQQSASIDSEEMGGGS